MSEVQLVKSKSEPKKPVIVGFFILQFAKLRNLEVYCNFFDNFSAVAEFEGLEMHTGSL